MCIAASHLLISTYESLTSRKRRAKCQHESERIPSRPIEVASTESRVTMSVLRGHTHTHRKGGIAAALLATTPNADPEGASSCSTSTRPRPEPYWRPGAPNARLCLLLPDPVEAGHKERGDGRCDGREGYDGFGSWVPPDPLLSLAPRLRSFITIIFGS